MRRFIGIATVAALAAVAVSFAEAAPKRSGVTPDLIQDAIAILEFNRDSAQWTKSGKPRVDAIESVLQADISAEDRDKAWNIYRTPVVQAVPVPVDTSQLEADLSAATQDRDAALADVLETRRLLEAARSRADRAEGTVEEAERRAASAEAHYAGLLDGAMADRRAAAELKSVAQSVLAEAEARERGSGPKSSRDCRTAITSRILDADTTWAGNLKVEKEDLKAVRSACLE